MRQSQLFTRTRREGPKDEVALNAQLLIRAGFAEKLMAGVYTLLPLGFRVLKKIESLIRAEMEALGGEEILMPGLQPKASWQATGRWETYDALFRFTSFYSKNEYALGPTHEEVVTPLVQKFNLSYRDLPFGVFQIQTKFRDEARAKSGLLRGREFLMKDLYSFHADEASLDEYYERMKESYRRIFRAAGIGHVTYLTFASGGSFAKYSHEFQTLTAAGEDTIHICDKCDLAVNEEIIAEQKVCPGCGNGDLREERAVETGNIFKLKTKYSDAFNFSFKNRDGSDKPVIMGCYGIGLTRLLGTIVEVHHDDKGMIWPEAVAPFRVHLVLLSEKEEVRRAADALYAMLGAKGIEVLYDDRSGVSAGEKFAEADLIGIPWRVVMSEKTWGKGKVEVKRRGEQEAVFLEEGEVVEKVRG